MTSKTQDGSPEGVTKFACYACGEKRPRFHPALPDGTPYVTLYEGSDTGGCRAIVICTTCFHRGDFDMWTDASEWNSKSPLVPYGLLPPYEHDSPDRDQVSKYPSPQELLERVRT